MKKQPKAESKEKSPVSDNSPGKDKMENPQEEIGGVKGPEPTRFGDWEKNGRCIDF